MKLGVVILPLPVPRDIQGAIGCVCMDDHGLTSASGLAKKCWSVSRTNNGYLPTEVSPMITNFEYEFQHMVPVMSC